MTAQEAAEVAALDRVFELAARLGEGMDRYLIAEGLTPARAEVLLVLHQRGSAVQRELSQVLRCTPRHVTGLIDALEASGHVIRNRHPTDRRAIMVSLTGAGTETAAQMNAARHEGARGMFGDIPARELDTFISVADRVLDKIRRADLADGSKPNLPSRGPH